MSIKRILDMDLPIGQTSFLWGPRQSGKSTYLKDTFPLSPRYDLLDSATYFRFLENPCRLREEIEFILPEKRVFPIIIDEIQKLPILLDEIHWMIENLKPASFILCGSSNRKLRKTGANFLGGRAWRSIFTPLVYPEIPNFDLLHIFKTGLLPPHYLNPEKSQRSIQAYIQNYVVQEIQAEGAVRKLRSFIRFLELMALSHGEILNFSNMARDCGVDAKTIKGYFEILEDMFLGTFVDVFMPRSGRHIMSAHPRFYFFDVGIANFLCHRTINALKGTEAGRAFEHYVFYEINAYKNLKKPNSVIQYWRTRYGYEVDFVINRGSVGIEVKMTDRVDQRDIKNLAEYLKDCPDSKCMVVCLEKHPRIMKTESGASIAILPIEYFLKELWSDTIFS